MDEKIVEEILDELFSSFEDAETQSRAILLFLKDQDIATEEKLAPFLEQAANASYVKWRAARVRMGALLASAMKTPEPGEEKKSDNSQAKTTEPAADAGPEKAAGQTSEQRPEDDSPKKTQEIVLRKDGAEQEEDAVARTQTKQNRGKSSPEETVPRDKAA